jgi:hypothetical protein
MKKWLLNLFWLMLLLSCSKDNDTPCVLTPAERRDVTRFSETHSARISAYIDKFWMGSAYGAKDTLFITLVEQRNLNRDSNWYRQNVLDTTSYNIFKYGFEMDYNDRVRWQQLHFKFEIMFNAYPRPDTSLFFHYPLKQYKLPSR